ncbi:unnamed protein product [Meloidogyne enterolobii]|uniref:Uncharacterized protein n=1 Tax=Meloidogyne enterolobii TaxID=390850 RepID=A0ACB1ANR7_MELEN
MASNNKNSPQAQALQAVADLEIEMMTDTYRRMTQSCQSKCINTSYRESELLKGFLINLFSGVSKLFYGPHSPCLIFVFYLFFGLLRFRTSFGLGARVIGFKPNRETFSMDPHLRDSFFILFIGVCCRFRIL